MIILQVISFSICRITAGDLYLGTTIGLFRYNPDTERFKRVPELGWTFVYYIKEDKQGNLWLATYADGVYKKECPYRWLGTFRT